MTMNSKVCLATAITELIDKIDNREIEYTEEEQKKIAYAINLCTVSVGQIMEYEDVNILEQEYESILNNLNLQAIPKDEPFLNIFTHLMDTLTFFRMYEEEKKFIEKEYQQKVKNAIWSSVSSFSILTDFTNPLSIATTIGSSYMNYRRAISDYTLGKDKEYWKLQKTAMEQLNGLQRELFSCVWHLEEKYNFPDEYRLSEKQIKQYNEILKDQNIARRYDRLKSIESSFEAFGPFWYFMGNAANIVYHDTEMHESLGLSTEKIDEYRNHAIECYNRFLNHGDYDIFRENPILSSCALELVDILNEDEKPDREAITEKINLAKEKAGGANDILELCALAYIKNSNIKEGMNLLRYLVNEQYNASLNAQLLSRLYAQIYVEDKNKGILEERKLLTSRVSYCYLFPIPEDCTKEELEKSDIFFTKYQKRDLRQKYYYALNKYLQKCNVGYEKLFEHYGHDSSYLERFVKQEYLSFFNSIIEDIRTLACIDNQKVLSDAQNSFADSIKNYAEDILRAYHEKEKDNWRGKNKRKEEVNESYEISFINEIAFSFFNFLAKGVKDRVALCKDLSELSELECNLMSFCSMEELGDPADYTREEMTTSSDGYLSLTVFGEDDEKGKAYDQLFNKMIKCVTDKCKDLFRDNSKTKCLINDETNKAFFDRFFNRCTITDKHLRSDTVAIISNENSGDDILLTIRGIQRVKRGFPTFKSLYSSVKWARNGKEALCLGTDIVNTNIPYKNADVKMENLLLLFKGLELIVGKDFDSTEVKDPLISLILNLDEEE